MAIREGLYTLYVFQEEDTFNYVMCTKLPNWQTSDIQVGDIGFLKYKEATAGEEYYDAQTGIVRKYLYTNLYFLDFIKKSEISNNKIIL